MTACEPLELEILPPYIGSAVSPTVDITETTTDVTVTITDFQGDHSYTIEKTDQAIADAEQAATNANTAAANATATANQAAQYARTTADQAAADAQETADAAAGRADTAAASANQAAQAATTAAGTANTAASNADAKAALADSKAALANTAATTANQAAEAAEAAKTAANTAAGQATTAAGNASTAAGTANTAATNADTKAQLADTAATNADTATQAANTATTNATNAAQAANSAADVAIEAAETITDGYFPHMLAGAAESLMDETDTATFAERVSEHDGNARIEAIKGNTVVWSQPYIGENTGGRIEIDGTKITIPTNYYANSTSLRELPEAIPAQHRVLQSCYFVSGKVGQAQYSAVGGYHKETGNNSWVGGISLPQNTTFDGQKVCTITTTDRTLTNIWIYMPANQDVQENIVFHYNIFDLTRMFGAGNEPATVEEFEAMFPDDYYPYNAGELLSVNIEGVNDREIPVSTYFPDGMKSAGSVYDELTATKAIKRVGVVDLGTLNYSHTETADGRHLFTTFSLQTFKNPIGQNAIDSIVIGYKPRYIGFSFTDNQYGADPTGNRIVFCDNEYTDTATFKAAMSGLLMYYALREPVETEIDPPLTLTYTVEQGGTESIVIPTGENSAAPTLAIVYGLTVDGVVDKALSVIAPIEGATASTNYSVNAYLVHDQQLYRVTSAIATGEAITPGSNCVACTVMGELARLTA